MDLNPEMGESSTYENDGELVVLGYADMDASNPALRKENYVYRVQ